MQQLDTEQAPPKPYLWLGTLGCLVLFGLYFGWQIEGPSVPTAVRTTPRSQEGIPLKISLPTAPSTAALRNVLQRWSGRSGAALEFVDEPSQADLAIIPAAEVGRFAARGELLPLPVEFQSSQHPAMWNRIALSYRVELGQWAGTILAVPIVGDTGMIVYRADKFADPQHAQAFAKRYAGRRLGPNALSTWEELLDVADYFQQAEGGPSLPPLPANPAQLVRLFSQIAACYDRPALLSVEQLKESFSFFLEARTGVPRLKANSFIAAAEWIAESGKYRPAGTGDAMTALLDGKAVLAIVTADELARLPRDAASEISPKFDVARLPGTRFWFNAAGARQKVNQPNYVPYLGAQTLVGVVFKRNNSAREQASWQAIMDLIEPAANAELLSLAQAGIGPIREEQLGNTDRDPLWFTYGFDAERSAHLADAMRNYATRAVSRPVIVMRAPDQNVLLAELAVCLQKIAVRELSPADGLSQAQANWEKLIATQAPAEVLRWRQSDAGVR